MTPAKQSPSRLDSAEDSAAPDSPGPKVLIAEDEPKLADLYEQWLDKRYETELAYSGEAALERLDDTFDVALLDRRMPQLSGDEVLERIRSDDVDCRVAMPTGVDPDFAIIDMGIDEYVIKPVTEEELYRVVDRLFELSSHERRVQELFALASTRAAIEAEKLPAELAKSEAYAGLLDEFDELREKIRQQPTGLAQEELQYLMGEIKTPV